MNKKKLVINVPMHCDKARSKAMKIAVVVEGVTSVSVGGNDRLEVIGEEVDSVCLVIALRKKFCFAEILSISEVKPTTPPPPPPPLPPYQPPPSCPPLLYYECSWVHDAHPNCCIM